METKAIITQQQLLQSILNNCKEQIARFEAELNSTGNREDYFKLRSKDNLKNMSPVEFYEYVKADIIENCFDESDNVYLDNSINDIEFRE